MKKVKFLVTCAITALTVVMMAITASANTGTQTLNIATLVETTGATLTAQFVALVTALMPVVVGIAVTGLGIYAIIYLFRLAKSLFAKAAG